MYLWAFLLTAAVGLVAGVVAITVGEGLRRGGRGSASGLRWACFGTGTLGAFLLVGGFLFPQLRGRTPPQDGVAFTPNPFTDPLVLSCGLGAFAVVVGWYLAVREPGTIAAGDASLQTARAAVTVILLTAASVAASLCRDRIGVVPAITGAISATRPSTSRTSARRPGPPSPSCTVPPEISVDVMTSLSRWADPSLPQGAASSSAR